MERNHEQLEVAVWSAVTFAALVASYAALRPVRDALILEGDLDQWPRLFLATLLAVGAASLGWSALVARRSPRGSVPLALHGFAACAIALCAIVRAELAPIAVGRVFYVWSAVFNLFVVSVFWSLLADLLGPVTARQLYGPIAAGGTVGAVVGPLLTHLLVGTIGTSGVLLMSALLLELAVIGVHHVRRAHARSGRDEAGLPGPTGEAPLGGGAATGIARVARSPYLLAIAGYVLCTAAAATLLYLAQATIVRAAIVDRVARADYFASIGLWTSFVVFVLQVLCAGPAIRRWGPGLVLAALPVVQIVGISVVAAFPSLTVLAVVQVIGQSATHGLVRPARELLFTVVSRDDKYRAKHAIDTVAYRLGDVASSWLRTGLVAVSAGSGALVGAAVPLTGIWLGLALVLGLGFRRRVPKIS